MPVFGCFYLLLPSVLFSIDYSNLMDLKNIKIDNQKYYLITHGTFFAEKSFQVFVIVSEN